MRALAEQTKEKEACYLFNCPRLEWLADGLAETIEALEKSKSTFKSSPPAEVRGKLEGIVDGKV